MLGSFGRCFLLHWSCHHL
jgi:hypothetical protein